MKYTYLLVCFAASFMACQSKTTENTGATTTTETGGSPSSLANTMWKGTDGNKYPLSYDFKDVSKVEMKDETGEIPNTYIGTYYQKVDSVFIEITDDKGGAGSTSPMFGYKQILVYQNNVLLLVADQMPMQKQDLYATPDKFVKE
jgi:hypothetical protein